jgi:hypothetical protein
MVDPWQILRDGGLPLATPTSGSRWSAQELAGAAREAIASNPQGRDAEALAAFLLAWHHHWATSFTGEFRLDGDGVLAWARRHATDDNRYLKLRRIAVENLASVL